MRDIHDIAPPVQVGIDPAMIKYALLGIGLIFILAIIVFVIRYFLKKKNRGKNNILLLPPPLPPDVAAFKELDLLRDFMERYPRLFCFRISGLLKTYLGKRFKINAPEMTTQELIMNLRNLDIDKKAAADARDFFLSLDDIKYAGATPSMDKMEHDHKFVRNLIESVSQDDSENDRSRSSKK